MYSNDENGRKELVNDLFEVIKKIDPMIDFSFFDDELYIYRNHQSMEDGNRWVDTLGYMSLRGTSIAECFRSIIDFEFIKEL